MSNYEYIITSLPVILPDYRYADGEGFEGMISEIRTDLSERDNALLDFLLRGFSADELTQDFYAEALRHRNRFLREYFRFDLNLRNAKVEYLNRQLGRPEGTDVMTGKGTDDDTDLDIDLMRFQSGEFAEMAKVEEILAGTDLIAREKGLDDLTWDKINSLTLFNYFDINAILGFVAKLRIADRWLALDEEAGREKFRQLTREVKGTFKGVKYTDQ
ncbi:MAG: DUF2764 family protein [Bacteroidales bacterium]|nr:DUF2764 family protein [Bacteroidales bacterium]